MDNERRFEMTFDEFIAEAKIGDVYGNDEGLFVILSLFDLHPSSTKKEKAFSLKVFYPKVKNIAFGFIINNDDYGVRVSGCNFFDNFPFETLRKLH